MSCQRCEGNYKIDLGNGEGETRTRQLVGGECPVCDSDPNDGDHRDYFIDYLGWEVCQKCESVSEAGGCDGGCDDEEEDKE